MRDGRPPQVMRVTFISYTRRIYSHTLWMVIGLKSYVPSCPNVTASYAISVRRAKILPAASFRFRLATDTLAVRLMVPTIRVHRGLAPPSHCLTTTVKQMALTRHAPCWAHTVRENTGGFRPVLLPGWTLDLYFCLVSMANFLNFL